MRWVNTEAWRKKAWITSWLWVPYFMYHPPLCVSIFPVPLYIIFQLESLFCFPFKTIVFIYNLTFSWLMQKVKTSGNWQPFDKTRSDFGWTWYFSPSSPTHFKPAQTKIQKSLNRNKQKPFQQKCDQTTLLTVKSKMYVCTFWVLFFTAVVHVHIITLMQRKRCIFLGSKIPENVFYPVSFIKCLITNEYNFGVNA